MALGCHWKTIIFEASPAVGSEAPGPQSRLGSKALDVFLADQNNFPWSGAKEGSGNGDRELWNWAYAASKECFQDKSMRQASYKLLPHKRSAARHGVMILFLL